VKRILSAAACLALLAAAAGTARADLITSPGQLSGLTQTVTFSPFSGSTTFLNNPVAVGPGITLSSSDPANSFVGDSPAGPYDLGYNGQLTNTGQHGFVALNSVDPNTFEFTGMLTFRFSSPVSQVGAFLNYFSPNPGDLPNGPDVFITALAANGSVLESYDLNQLAPVLTAGGTDQEAFRGIARRQNDIAAFQLSNQFVATNEVAFATEVPEPSTLALAGLSVLSLLGYRWRRGVWPRPGGERSPPGRG
jgi:hypothetical protein